MIILELGKTVKIKDLFTNKTKEEKLKIIKKILIDVINGLYYMHMLGYNHLDLKFGNVILGDDGYYKLIDFGFTQKIEENHFVSMRKGTYIYAPYELLKNRNINIKTDTFYLGMMAMHLFTEDTFNISKKFRSDKIKEKTPR